ncbi:MAG: hypothetical protein KUG77_00030 [Nannocystaceae bacterium]|nr:hypothetical protein [Nannocystaceae bacterium]
MAEPRLGPDELDRLEDALEGLEALDDLHDASEAVSSRLAEFQVILQASREALPLEDVRPGVLDGVISEARMSAPDMRSPAADPTPRPSLWVRAQRAWLLPGLAVAGTAGLVLILVKPMADESPPQQTSAAVATHKDSSRGTPDLSGSPAPASDLPSKVAGGAEAEAPGGGRAGLGDTSAPAPAAAAPTIRSAAGQREAPALDLPEPELEPSPQVRGEDELASEQKPSISEKGWNAIEQGDSAREGGDCFSARNHYARALDDGNDSVRARAYVGMGLCKREDGNAAAAEEYIDKARELDEDAVKFADTRANDEPSKPSSRKPRKKASRKRKSSMDFAESMDPLKGL